MRTYNRGLLTPTAAGMSYAMQGSLSRGGGGGYADQQQQHKEQTLMWQQGHYMGPDSGIQSGAQTQVVMSKTKGQTFRYRFGNETKNVPKYLLLKSVCFKFVQNLLSKYKGSLSIGQIRERTQWFFFVLFILDIGMFAERLWNVCSFTVLTLLNPGPLPHRRPRRRGYGHHGRRRRCTL